jgi:eukaryotic-like serine/threonine-protein kinase
MGSDSFGLLGVTIHGRYRVDEVVGEGGFGLVYRGYHLSFEHSIALKCLKIPSHFTPKAEQLFFERFREEGKLLSKLSDHPSIVRVFDFGVTQSRTGASVPFLVLEWLQGGDLECLLEHRSKPFAEKEALRVLRPCIDAIALAHTLGIAHRDLKPANLYLAETPRGKVLKVLDFGIAKAMQEGETATQLATRTASGFSAFSPRHGAPEQFRSKKYGSTGPWTDVHALGLILAEMMLGHPALRGEELGDYMEDATSVERPTPRARGVVVSDEFEALCAKAVARAPADRFPNAGEMLKAVDALLGIKHDHMLGLLSGGLSEPPAALMPDAGPETVAAGPATAAVLASGAIGAEGARLSDAELVAATAPADVVAQLHSSIGPSGTLVTSHAEVARQLDAAQSHQQAQQQQAQTMNAAALGATRPSAELLQPGARASMTTPGMAVTQAQMARPRRILPFVLGWIGLFIVSGVIYLAFVRRPQPRDEARDEATSASLATSTTVEVGTMPVAEPPNRWIQVAAPTSAGSDGPYLGVASEKSSQWGFRPSLKVRPPSYPYEIEQHEVSWAELRPWLQKHPGHVVNEPGWSRDARLSDEARARLPATGVPWETARAYCSDIGGKLPTEAEWEYAARGPALRPNPWGAERVDLTKVHAYRPGRPLSAVMTNEQDATPGSKDAAIYDMAGNAWEWTADVFRGDSPGDAAAPGPTDYTVRAIRGLPPAFAHPTNEAIPAEAASYRDAVCASGKCPAAANDYLPFVGFRCVRPSPSSAK